MNYFERAVDKELCEILEVLGGVLIEGPRGCGKSATGIYHSASSYRLDSGPEIMQLAELNPTEILAGKTPLLIDEWQLAPSLWNTVRHEIDSRAKSGQFILCGSATPADDITRHTGAGRIARLRMRPMSLAETGASNRKIRLSELVENHGCQISGRSPLSYLDMAACAAVGGWPGLLGRTDRQARIFNRSYLENLHSSDIYSASLPRHNQLALSRFMQSIARHLSASPKLSTLAADVGAIARGNTDEISRNTASAYLDSLARLFVYEPLQPWSVALRSKSRLQAACKIHLCDPSLAVAALGANVDRLARDPEYFGQVFESLAVRDLRIYAQTLGGKVYFYRDNTNLEVDAVIEFSDGRWAGVEIKLGGNWIDEGEANLLKLRDQRVDLTKVGEPAFLAVITATEFAMTRPSGVHIIPLGCLSW